MQKNTQMIIAVIISVLFSPVALFADTVTLKSGKRINGKILEKTDGYIKINVNGAPLYFERKYIEGIDEDKEPVKSQAPLPEEPSLNDAKLYLKSGLKYGAEGKYVEAEEAVRKGLQTNPDDNNLQEVLRLLDDLKTGKIAQKYAAYLFKGSDYLINEQYKEAIEQFQEALKLQPADADILYYLGISHYSLEEYRQAVEYLERSIKLRSSEEVYYYLGVSYYALGQYSQAVTYLKRALEIDPDDAEACSVMGTIYFLLGEPAQAKEYLNKAKKLYQKEGDYLKAGDIDTLLNRIAEPSKY